MDEQSIEVGPDEVVVTVTDDGKVCLVSDELHVYLMAGTFGGIVADVFLRRARSALYVCETPDQLVHYLRQYTVSDKFTAPVRAVWAHMYKPYTRFMGPTGPQGMQGGYGPSSTGPTGPIVS